jgi:pilus assembly protein CpaC
MRHSGIDPVGISLPVLPWLAALGLGFYLVLASPVSGQRFGQPQFVTSTEGEVSLARGTSAVLVSDVDFARVSISDPEIAEAVVIGPKEVLVNGRNLGITTFVVWDTLGARHIYEVEVTADASAIQRSLETLLPEETIQVTARGNTLVFSGPVSSAFVARRALQLAEGTGAQVIDNLQTPAPSQIRLQVRFAEVSRTALQSLGNQIVSILNPHELASDGDFRTQTDSNGQIDFSLINSDANLQIILLALSEFGDFTSLAEPTLLALDGEEASFLAGGEFPFPSVQGNTANNAVSIEWREFGVRLNFTPTVTNIGNIRLDIAPEVSALDFGGGLAISGFNLPSILSRRAETQVELREGQHLAIAGLMDRTIQENVQKLPFLGDIPILGKLFQNRDERQEVSELLVIVSPTIVTPSDELPDLPTGDPVDWEWNDRLRDLATDSARSGG